MKDPDHKAVIYMDITKKGGHPVYLIQNREVKDQKISLNDGSNRALAFLKKNGFETDDLEIDESAQYDKIGVFSYVPVENKVRMYPEAIRMKVLWMTVRLSAFQQETSSHPTEKEPYLSLKLLKQRQSLN